MNKPALEVRDLRAGYGGGEVLRGVSFALHAGELLAVAGPNGSGKSTLLRAITGLVPASAGHVGISGRESATLDARERARLCATQPQAEAPVFDYRVDEFVLLGRHPHRHLLAPAGPDDFTAVAAAIKDTGLESFAARSVRSLSLGEWQRVLLARTLAQQAPVILLDEPAAHLDPGHSHAMHALLRSLARERGRAVLCVSHDLNLAAAFADRMLLLSNGSIRAAGTPDEVMREEILQEVFGCAALRVSTNALTGRPGMFFTS